MRKLLLLCSYLQLAAQPVITEYEGIRLDWSQLQLRFSGRATGTRWATLEQAAWQNGFQQLKRSLPQIYANHHPTATAAGTLQQRATRVFRHLQLQQTTFFSDWRAQLDFSSLLPIVFTTPVRVGTMVSKTLPRPRHSGLILRAQQAFPPRAVYTIWGNNGQRYFDISMVQEKHFHRTLMGRYFHSATASQLVRYIGHRPQELAVREIAPAMFEVDAAAWEKFASGNTTLLAQARIVCVFSSNKRY